MVSNTLSYKITDIFYSIQGEGFFTGKPAVFVRFFGCNLSCAFCDEDKYDKTSADYSAEHILLEIRKYSPCRFVVLTGGEPTLQEDLSALIEMLQKDEFFVAVETNGTNRIEAHPDWITVSPKTEEFYYGDELKLLFQDQELKQFENLPFKHFYLQPINHENDLDFSAVERCIKMVKENPKWKLSIQLHKILKIK